MKKNNAAGASSNSVYADENFVDGNFEDKYNAKNPISKMLVQGFITHFTDLVQTFEKPQSKTEPKNIVEIGAGEGELTEMVAQRFSAAEIVACDISDRVNDMAKKKLAQYKNTSVQKENAEKVTFKDSSMDMVICCEVLEHVEHPDKAIGEIHRILKPGGRAIVSVPLEPIWRFLNLCRLQYVSDLGNTPGHLNHWSRGSFKRFVSQAGFKVVQDQSPFPWTMLLIEKTS